MIKELLPDSIHRPLSLIRLKYRIRRTSRLHEKRIKEIREKNQIKVAFLLVNESIWKYERLYLLMKNNPRYNPVVFVCPFIVFEKNLIKEEMENSFRHFKNKGYDVVNTLQSDGSYLDVKKGFRPDLVFFCTPWNITLELYGIFNFMNVLTCYVPYAFMTSNLHDAHFNKPLHNFVWKYFLPTKAHLGMYDLYSKRHPGNVEVLGYPGLDNYLHRKKLNAFTDVWKKQFKTKKKIIWAPHHTIPHENSSVDYSTFLRYCDFMLEIANKFNDSIQIAFKPHPNLKGKLYEYWGEEKTNQYYSIWANLENGQLEEGEYIDLFGTSDAMIHDCSSFIVEYLVTGKPVMFLVNNEEMMRQFNEIGIHAMNSIEKGHSQEDIIKFLDNTVLKGEDKMKTHRRKFYNDLVEYQDSKLSSERIFEYLDSFFDNREKQFSI